MAVMGFPGDSDGKEPACNARDLGLIPGWDDLLDEEMATCSSILAWRIPWTKEPCRLQSTGLQRVRHVWAIHTCTYGCNSVNLKFRVRISEFKFGLSHLQSSNENQIMSHTNVCVCVCGVLVCVCVVKGHFHIWISSHTFFSFKCGQMFWLHSRLKSN